MDYDMDKYTKLCNFFWYLEHPEWEGDGFSHTSDRCRELAAEVFRVFALGADEPACVPDALAGFFESLEGHNFSSERSRELAKEVFGLMEVDPMIH